MTGCSQARSCDLACNELDSDKADYIFQATSISNNVYQDGI